MILYKNKKLVIPTGINPHYLADSPVINNQDKTVNIDANGKTVVTYDPEFTGLGNVTINTYVGDAVIQPFYSTKFTENGEFDIFPDAGYDAIAEVEIEVDVQPELEAKTVNSSTNEQVITTEKYGLSSVTVNPYTLDEKTVDSSTNPQVVTSDVNGLSSVTINPYVLTSLEVDSSTATQEFSGQFSTVSVNPYSLDSSSAVVTENGDYVFESRVDGLSRVDVSVNIDTQSYYDSGYTAGEVDGIAEQKAKLDSSTFIENGTYTREDGWDEITVAVPSIRNQNKTVDSSTVSQSLSYDSGYTGLGTVTVNPYVLDSKTVNSSTNLQTVVSSEDGLASVTVNPYVLDSKTVDSSTVSQTVISSEDGLSSVIVNPYTLQNKSSSYPAAWVTSDVEPVPATITVTPDSSYNGLSSVVVPRVPILSSITLNPSASADVTWDENDTDYLSGVGSVVVPKVTAAIDSNIVAGNIKEGTSILGVTGTYTGDPYKNESYIENGAYVSSSTSSSSIYFDTGLTYVAPTNSNFFFEIKFSPVYTAASGVAQCIFGTSDNDDSDLALDYGGNVCSLWFNAYTQNTPMSPTVHIVRGYAVDNPTSTTHQIRWSLDGAYKGLIGDEPYSGASNIFLFKNYLSAYAHPCCPGTRIYYFKIYATDNILHEFVPAYNNNKYCFYDKATGNYIYAQGGTATGHIYS